MGDVLADLATGILREYDLRAEAWPELWGDHDWQMLLDLYTEGAKGKQVTVSDACIASRAPGTTALRCVSRLENLGIIQRHAADHDRRYQYLSLTQSAVERMRDYLVVLYARLHPPQRAF